jgi:hypothetical protein
VDFALFLAVVAIQFIRPNDLIPALGSIPLYLIAVVLCILFSWHKMLGLLSARGLQECPVLAFGIGILLVSIISNTARRQFTFGIDFAAGFSKVLIFYLLLLAIVDTPRRFRQFLASLIPIIAIPIIVVMCHFYGYVHIEAFDRPENPDPSLRRMSGAGNFGDPNDICEILNCATIFTLCSLFNRDGGCSRVVWILPLGLFGRALSLTQSRGGFLAALAGLLVLLRARFRGAKWLVMAALGLLLMFVGFAGRQTSIDASQGTAQGRIQGWNIAFSLMQRSPLNLLIGTGFGQLQMHTTHVAHNGFIQLYTELGFFGGTLLFGQFFYCLTNLAKMGASGVVLPDPTMRRLRPYVMAALVSFGTSEMSLTNPCSLIAYTMLGQASVFVRLANPIPPLPDLLLSRALFRRVFVFSALFLMSLFVFTKVMVRY